MKKIILIAFLFPITCNSYAGGKTISNQNDESFLGLHLGYKYNVELNENTIRYQVPNNSNIFGITHANATFDKKGNLLRVFGDVFFKNNTLCNNALNKDKKNKLLNGYSILKESKDYISLLSNDKRTLIINRCSNVYSLDFLFTEAFINDKKNKKLNFDYKILEKKDYDFTNNGYTIIKSEKDKKITIPEIFNTEKLGKIFESNKPKEIIKKKDSNNLPYYLILNDKKELSGIAKAYAGVDPLTCRLLLEKASKDFYNLTNFEHYFNYDKNVSYYINNNLIVSQYCKYTDNKYALITYYSDIRYNLNFSEFIHVLNNQKEILK